MVAGRKEKSPAGAWRRLILAASIILFSSQVCAAQQSNASQHPLDLGALFQVVASIYHVDPDLLRAIAKIESNNNPAAVSPAGAEGIMQLMPSTAREFQVTNSFDPVENVLGAAKFLNYLHDWAQQHRDRRPTLPEVIAAYNAGPGAVDRSNGIPNSGETREYVRNVLLAYLLDQPPTQRNIALPSVSANPPAKRPSTKLSRDFEQPALDQLTEIRAQREHAQASARPADHRETHSGKTSPIAGGGLR